MALFGNGTVGNPSSTTPVGNPNRQKGADGFDMGGASGLGRTNVNNAPIIGTATTRADYAKRQAGAPPPSALEAASTSIGGAKSAAERTRKRAAAGDALVAGAAKAGPGAVLAPKSLVGA